MHHAALTITERD